MVAPDHHEPHLAALEHDRERLQQRTGGDRELARDRFHGGGARRVDALRRREARRERNGLGVGTRDFDVGGIAGSEHDVVLSGRAWRHVLVGADAAHHPDVGLDPVPLQAAAVEHAVIRGAVALVGSVEPGTVAVERVGVLHHELAGPEHSGSRPGLIALLDLEVVEDQRQVTVGLDRGGYVPGDYLLVRHRQHHVRAPAVLELEQLRDRIAPGAAPGLGRMEHRHQHLLPPDRVHLLANDLDNPLMHPPAGREPAPQSGTDLTDQAGADHQLVRDRLGVRRGLALGRKEVGREQGHGEGKPIRRRSVQPPGAV